jgi:hypothetical protein
VSSIRSILTFFSRNRFCNITFVHISVCLTDVINRKRHPGIRVVLIFTVSCALIHTRVDCRLLFHQQVLLLCDVLAHELTVRTYVDGGYSVARLMAAL